MKDISLIVYPVTDLTKAKQFFGAVMGSDPYVDSPYYVGYKSRNGEMEIGLDPNGSRNGSGALAYWTVSDIAASVKQLEDAGGTLVQPIADVANGLLVASVKDANGATVGLRQMPKG